MHECVLHSWLHTHQKNSKISQNSSGKTRRIKQAREEAQAEVEFYRMERDRLFKQYEAKHLGSKEDIAAKIDKDTEENLNCMARSVEFNKNKVKNT